MTAKITEKAQLFQWDTNQTLTVTGGARFVDFSYPEEIVRIEVFDGLCKIPDTWLQTSGIKTLWVCMADNTRIAMSLMIKARPIPPDYVSTPEQRVTFDNLVEKVDDLVDDIQERADRGDFDGKDGYTPQKGIDYFDGKDGYTPIKGKDYFDGKDGYTPVKGIDYFDGKDGENYTITEADYQAIGAIVEEQLTPQLDALQANKADKTEVAALAAVVDTKADKTALDETNRDVEFLKLVTKDVNWTKEEREENGHATLPKGGLFGNVDEVRGKTEQETTNGYQLIDVTQRTWDSGLTREGVVVRVEDGAVILNGTSTKAWIGAFMTNVSYPTGTYTLSLNNPVAVASNSVQIRVVAGSNIATHANVVNAVARINATSPITGFAIRFESGVTFDNFIIKPMLETGSTAHPWEKFTGGLAMPNPDYPSEIVSVNEIRIAKRGYDNQPFREWLSGFISGSGNDYIPKYNASFPDAKASTQLIPVKRGDTVNIKIVGGDIISDVRCRLIADDGYITGYMFPSASGREASEVVTLTNAAYIAPMVLNASVTNLYITVNKPMSEEEEQRTIIPPRPLNAIGEYKDKLNVVSGEWEYKMKKINISDLGLTLHSSSSFWKNSEFDDIENIDNVNKMTLAVATEYTPTAPIAFLPAKIGTMAQYANDAGIRLCNGSTTVKPTGTMIYVAKNTATEPIDPADLDYLRNLTLNKGENLFITDNHGRDVSYLMSDFINLKEALS